MILSIITINRNNAPGLEKTMASVLAQTYTVFEYVVVDGASTDGSVEVIKRYAEAFGSRIKWVSEPDTGIYNAMNKGIRLATGEYLEFLNSGDRLVSGNVLIKMQGACEQNEKPSILYGNMLKEIWVDKSLRSKSFAGKDITFLGFYTGTLNHPPAWIKRSLFEKYGLYDESLHIVSDWKWFLQAIIFGGEKPVYVDEDVVFFDMTGISERNKELDREERRKVLEMLIPATILADYDKNALFIDQMSRLQRHRWAYKIVWFLERCLFKVEKRSLLKQNTVHL